MSDDLEARVAALEEAIVCLCKAMDDRAAHARRLILLREEAMIAAAGSGHEGDVHAHMRALAEDIRDALDTPGWPYPGRPPAADSSS